MELPFILIDIDIEIDIHYNNKRWKAVRNGLIHETEESNMNHFIVKTKVFCGDKALFHIGDLPITRACIVCDRFVAESGMLNEIFAQLEAIPAEYHIFSDVIPDPDYATVAKGVADIKASGCDAIISVGGGSVLDTAKLIGLIYGNCSDGKRPITIAIPTTSGTGSEMTSFSVITDTENEVKYPLEAEGMLPDYAILDARFTQSVPPSVTADTGFDVLTHALEAYVSPLATDFSDAFAEKAVSLVCHNLPLAVADGMNLAARTAMLNASCMAGIAFNHAKLGLCHSMAHALGAHFHVSHGRSNAVFLPSVIAFNAGLDRDIAISGIPVRQKYAVISRILGLTGASDRELTDRLVESILELRRNTGLPQGARDLGINQSDYEKAIDGLSDRAFHDTCTATNPVTPHLQQVKKLFRKAF